MRDKDTKLLEEAYENMFNKLVNEVITPNGNRNKQQVSPTAATTNPNTATPEAKAATTGTTGTTSTGSAPAAPAAPATGTAAPGAPTAPATTETGTTDPTTVAPVQQPVDTDPNSNFNQMMVAAEADPNYINTIAQQGFVNPMNNQQATPEEIQQFVQYYQQQGMR